MKRFERSFNRLDIALYKNVHLLCYDPGREPSVGTKHPRLPLSQPWGD